MVRERRIDVGEARAQKLARRARGGEKASEEELSLVAHRGVKGGGVVGERARIGLVIRTAKVEPLSGEVFGEGRGAGIGEHAFDLPGELGVVLKCARIRGAGE